MVGQGAEKAVGVADRQHAHLGRGFHLVGAAVTHGAALLQGADIADGGFEGHHRLQSQLHRAVAAAVEQNPRADHVQGHLGVEGGGAAVGAVVEGEGVASLLHGGIEPAEELVLAQGEGLAVPILRLVGDGEVGEDALRRQVRQGTGPTGGGDALVKAAAGAGEAQAGHAGVHLDVDGQGAAALLRGLAV